MLETILRSCETLPPREAIKVLEEAQKYLNIRMCEQRNWESYCKHQTDRECNSCQNGYKKLSELVRNQKV